MFFKSSLRIFGLVVFDTAAIVILFRVIKPIASWYLSRSPALGVDLYNSATYVSYHLKHFSWPFNSFKDIWFAGYPLMRDFPQVSFYLMLPFGKFFGEVFGVQVFAVFSLFLLLAFSYLLYFKLSKNFGLSIFLAILTALSPNIYGALTWAGSIPYFASQAFFPLALLFGAKYLEKPNGRHLAMMVLVSGLATLIHPLSVATFIIPSMVLLIICGNLAASNRWLLITKHFFFYLFGFILATFVITYDYFLTLFYSRKIPIFSTTSVSGEVKDLSPTAQAISQFYKDQIALIYTQTNKFLFFILISSFLLLIIALIFKDNRRKALFVFPFLLIAIYTIAHPILNLSGTLNFFRHDPYRAFWPIPIVIGALVASCWGYFLAILKKKLEGWGKILGKSLNIIFILGLTLGFFTLSYFVYTTEINKVVDRVESRSEFSSAFPEALSINLQKEELEKLKKQLLPSFIDPNDKNKRLYEGDASVNIWWNTFFDLPLARGYLDPPIGTERRGGFFTLDISIANDSIVRDFKWDEEQALNTALFYIDWYGVYYFEGGRLGTKGPSVPPSSYLLKNNIFDKQEEVTTYGAVIKYGTVSGKPELHMELPQKLKFYQIAPQFTSPILAPTNAPPVIIFSNFQGYEDILRILASQNLNSKKFIPVYGGEFIDEVSLSQLKTFDAIILHQYRYHNKKKTFDILENYVKEGGKIFIDTGGETKESNSSSLPEIFPITSSVREGLGKSWDFSVEPNKITEGVNFNQFGPPIFTQDEWKLSTPKNENDLHPDSKVILKHQNKPLLVERKLGSGQVIWSGLNLPYHFSQYKVSDEAKLFKNILSQFIPLEEKAIVPAKTAWLRPEKVQITFDGKVRGVLFKEQGYESWRAKLISPQNEKLPIYLAGPTYPGFMYVPLKDTAIESKTIEFFYSGRILFWFASLVNLLTILLLLELAIFNGKFIGKRVNFLWLKIRSLLSFWWEKEE